MTEQVPEWEYMPDGWSSLDNPKIAGWDMDSVVAAETATWPSFIEVLHSSQALGVHGVSTVPDIFTHNVNMAFGYVLARAANGRTSISLLDWGCGLGQHYAIARALWPELEVRYTGVDLPAPIRAAIELTPDARFIDDESWRDETYDLVMANGSLHYVEDWRPLLGAMVRSAERYLYVTQLPVVSGPPYVYVQRPYAFGYNTEYLSWAINKDEFIAAANNAGARLEREFIAGLRPPIFQCTGAL